MVFATIEPPERNKQVSACLFLVFELGNARVCQQALGFDLGEIERIMDCRDVLDSKMCRKIIAHTARNCDNVCRARIEQANEPTIDCAAKPFLVLQTRCRMLANYRRMPCDFACDEVDIIGAIEQ